MNRDVVVATIKNYDWAEIMAFVVSLDRSGFSGAKIMFNENITETARNKLIHYGWTLVNVIADPTQSYATARHIPVVDYLTEHKDDYRFVLYIDVRDAVFQSDPSSWLEKNLAPDELVGPSECVLIKHQNVNSRWIKETMGEEIERYLGEYDVCCCGTIVGTTQTVLKVVSQMCEMSKNISGWGYDQAYFNYLIRISPLQEVTRVLKMKEGFIATCSWFLCDPHLWKPFLIDDVPVFDYEKVLVYVPGTTTPFPILHQYDRNSFWARAIQEKYSDKLPTDVAFII